MLKQLDAAPRTPTTHPRRFRRAGPARTLILGPAALAVSAGGSPALGAPVAVRSALLDAGAPAQPTLPAPATPTAPAHPPVATAAPPTETTPAVRPLTADASMSPPGPPVEPGDDRPAAVAPEPPLPASHRPPAPPPPPELSLPERTRPLARHRHRHLGPAARIVLGLVAATAALVIVVALLIGPGHPSAHTPRSALSPASTTLPAPTLPAVTHHQTVRRRVVHRSTALRRGRRHARHRRPHRA